MSTHTTAIGTPCARTWSDEWIATVDTAESQLSHRIFVAPAFRGGRLPYDDIQGAQ